MMEPPLSTGERMSVNDPLRSIATWKADVHAMRGIDMSGHTDQKPSARP